MSIKKIVWLVVIVLIAGITWFAWPRLPIITAFAAKGMCSSVFLAEKTPEQVEAEDLSFFPINLAKNEIDYKEQSVTSTVFGLGKRKAVFREGTGAVIVLDTPVEELKKVSFKIPEPVFSQDTVPWPMGDVIDYDIPGNVDVDRLNELIDTCFDAPGEEAFKKTLGIVVVYDNKLIAEKYLGNYDLYTRFHGWSMTKTITGAVAGILADQNLLSPEEPAGMGLKEKAGFSNISVKDVIRMSSGLDWFENYFTISDATVMLMQSEDMLKSVTDNELLYDSGSHWNYSSGDANLLSGIIRDRLRDDEFYHKLPYEKLFYPLGMHHITMETDAKGLFVASSYSYGTTRDWARFGMLFMNEGIFDGDTILSKEWVDFMKEPAPASEGKYAGTFWLQEPDPENALTDVPEDVFFADGFLGQRVYIIPSAKLVVVRMGYGLSNFKMNDFLREILASIR